MPAPFRCLSTVLLVSALGLSPGLGSEPGGEMTSAGGHPSWFAVAKSKHFGDFGRAVAIDGDRMVGGAPDQLDLGEGIGAVYVFDRQEGGEWTESARLLPSDRDDGSDFGDALAVEGDTLVVGALRRNDLRGAAYVFEADPGAPEGWVEVTRLLAWEPRFGDFFGASVAISGDRVLVGAPEDEEKLFVERGSAFVFVRDPLGRDGWSREAKLVASDAEWQDKFGESVDIDGDTAVVGAYFDDDRGVNSGSAYVFERQEDGEWLEVAKITASDGGEDDRFGWDVAIDGDRIVVGMAWPPLPDRPGGAGYLYERDAGAPGAWGEVAELHPPDVEAGDGLGGSVAIEGDTVVLGARGEDVLGSESGSVYVFERGPGLGEWNLRAKVTAPEGTAGDHFGQSVAISGATIVAGAPDDEDYLQGRGSAYLFEPTTVTPELAVSGTCPGLVTFTASGLTPLGRAAAYGGRAEGAHPIAGGHCLGTVLGLDDARRMGEIGWADAAGILSATREVSEGSCGFFFQAIDATTCAVSAAVRLPR